MTDNNPKKRTWAEISLANIKSNYEAIRRAIPETARFLGVVKADAYGHGAVPVAKTLQAAGADYLAVSCLDEALELRNNGITMPVLILGHTPPEYTGTLIDSNITQAVTCLAKAEEYSAAAKALNKTLRIHIKVDTGMSRLGFLCDGSLSEDGVDNIARSCVLPNLSPEGIFTHFAVSDEAGEENREYTLRQFNLFMHVIGELKSRYNIEFQIRHCANSGAVINYPEMALDMVRPGLLLYGYGDAENKLGLKSCMTFKTTVSTIKTYEEGTSVSYGRRFITRHRTRVGVLACGYADGLPRASSGKCEFYAESGFTPQIGNICMDMCMCDLSALPDVSVGDEIELFGEHASVDKMAAAAYTISYELLCSVTKRVPRIYIN